jgi:hypothetical protein
LSNEKGFVADNMKMYVPAVQAQMRSGRPIFLYVFQNGWVRQVNQEEFQLLKNSVQSVQYWCVGAATGPARQRLLLLRQEKSVKVTDSVEKDINNGVTDLFGLADFNKVLWLTTYQ